MAPFHKQEVLGTSQGRGRWHWLCWEHAGGLACKDEAGYPCFGPPERPWVIKIARVETAPGLVAWSPLQRAKSRCCPKHDTAVTLELLQRKGALQRDLKKAEVSSIRTGREKAVPGASFLLCWWLLQPLRRGRNTAIPSVRQGCWLVGRSPF